MFYRNASAVCMVYDIASERSFENLKRWKKDVDQHRPSNSILVLIGNKSDLVGKEAVEMKEV